MSMTGSDAKDRPRWLVAVHSGPTPHRTLADPDALARGIKHKNVYGFTVAIDALVP